VDAASYGNGSDSQDASCFLGAHPEPVDEHECFPLSSGERGYGISNLPERIGGLDRVLAGSHSEQPPCADRQVPEALPIEIHRQAVGVSTWRLHRPDPMPTLVHPGHSLLRQLFGFALVRREQVEGAYEAPLLSLEEPLELEGPHCAPLSRLAPPPY